MSQPLNVLKAIKLNTTLASMIHSICSNEENLSAGITGDLARLAVDLDDAIHIIRDLGKLYI